MFKYINVLVVFVFTSCCGNQTNLHRVSDSSLDEVSFDSSLIDNLRVYDEVTLIEMPVDSNSLSLKKADFSKGLVESYQFRQINKSFYNQKDMIVIMFTRFEAKDNSNYYASFFESSEPITYTSYVMEIQRTDWEKIKEIAYSVHEDSDLEKAQTRCEFCNYHTLLFRNKVNSDLDGKVKDLYEYIERSYKSKLLSAKVE